MSAYVSLTNSALKLHISRALVCLPIRSLASKSPNTDSESYWHLSDSSKTKSVKSSWRESERKFHHVHCISRAVQSVLVMWHYIMHYTNYTVNRALHYWWNQRAGLECGSNVCNDLLMNDAMTLWDCAETNNHNMPFEKNLCDGRIGQKVTVQSGHVQFFNMVEFSVRKHFSAL